MRSSATQEELGVELLLLHTGRNQLRWLRHLLRVPPEGLPGEAFWTLEGRCSRLAWERLGSQLDELHEETREPLGVSAGLGFRVLFRVLGLATGSSKRQKMDG